MLEPLLPSLCHSLRHPRVSPSAFKLQTIQNDRITSSAPKRVSEEVKAKQSPRLGLARLLTVGTNMSLVPGGGVDWPLVLDFRAPGVTTGRCPGPTRAAFTAERGTFRVIFCPKIHNMGASSML